tara:strand:- start:747 stop:953 length:207 start_codon:yes stop_codon:yes gene_type:complete
MIEEIVERKVMGHVTKVKRFRNSAVKDYNNFKYFYKTHDGKWDNLTNTQIRKKVHRAYMIQKGFLPDL